MSMARKRSVANIVAKIVAGYGSSRVDIAKCAESPQCCITFHVLPVASTVKLGSAKSHLGWDLALAAESPPRG